MRTRPPRNVPRSSGAATEAFVDRERHNPYFRWLLHLGAPLTVSLMLHAILFSALALKTWSWLESADPAEYGVGLTDAADAFGELRWPGEALEKLDAPVTPELDPFRFSDLVDLTQAAEQFSENPAAVSEGGFGIGESGRAGLIGIGGGAGESGGGGGLGSGFGLGSGLGAAGVWNLNVTGTSFVYVIDFSGSVIVAVDELKRELRRSIGNLTAKQTFNVFVFYSVGDHSSDRLVTEAFESALQLATPELKKRFFSWIDGKSPQGSTEPLLAMKRALALKPDAIFFFSDGYFDEKIVAAVAQANRSAKSQIHCLVFDEVLLQETNDSGRLTDGARRLKRIAEESRGKFKVVTGADLRR